MKIVKSLTAVSVSLGLAIGVMASANAMPMTMTTGSTGGGQPQSTTQPSLALTPLVRTQSTSFDRLGEVVWFAGNFAPQGWTLAEGQLLQVNQNSALFSKLGNTFGGDGRTTFGLPDLRGRVAVGEGQGAGLNNVFWGQKFGADPVTLPLPQHTHGGLPSPPGGNTDPTGGGNQTYNNNQPSLGINYLVSQDGVFPARGGSPFRPTLNPTTAFVEMYAGSPFFSALGPGYSEANGQPVPINQNLALFSLIGTTYGGDGRTTFGLPDLRGRTPIGVGTGPGLSPQSLGQEQGVETLTMMQTTLAPHDHMLDPNDPGAPGTTDSTGGGQPQTNMQPTLGLTYLINAGGDFPSQGSSTPNPLDPFIGQIGIFGGNFVPDGWLGAEGQFLLISQFPDLFAVLGTIFGGDGVTTFRLPDLRGRVAVGAGVSPDAGVLPWVLGQTRGVEDNIMTIAQMQPHTHDYLVNIQTTVVPAPGALAIFGLGLIGLGILRQRRAET